MNSAAAAAAPVAALIRLRLSLLLWDFLFIYLFLGVFCFRAPDPCACYEIQEAEQIDALCAIVLAPHPPCLFLTFSVCFSCFSFCLLCVLFLFCGGVREGVGEEEKEEEEERGGGDMVMRTWWSSRWACLLTAFQDEFQVLFLLAGNRKKDFFSPPEKVSIVYWFLCFCVSRFSSSSEQWVVERDEFIILFYFRPSSLCFLLDCGFAWYV